MYAAVSAVRYREEASEVEWNCAMAFLGKDMKENHKVTMHWWSCHKDDCKTVRAVPFLDSECELLRLQRHQANP